MSFLVAVYIYAFSVINLMAKVGLDDKNHVVTEGPSYRKLFFFGEKPTRFTLYKTFFLLITVSLGILSEFCWRFWCFCVLPYYVSFTLYFRLLFFVCVCRIHY